MARNRIRDTTSIVFALLLAFLPCAYASDTGTWKEIKGAPLHALFAHKELGDGVHYAYRFRSDGTFSGTEMARDVDGTWRTTQDEICWKWKRPPGAEECYKVQKNGAEIRLLLNGVEAWYGTLK